MTTKFYGLSKEVCQLLYKMYWVDTQGGDSSSIEKEIEQYFRNVHKPIFIGNEKADLEEALRIQIEFNNFKESVGKYYADLCVVLSYGSEPVTVFVNDDKKLKGEPCVDYRFGTQILPHGSWVIGYFVPGKYAVVNNLYFSNAAQMRQCKKVLREALHMAGEISPNVNRLVKKGTLPLTGKLP